jgi:alpha-beta hydrolase superfamily lysophospholipase
MSDAKARATEGRISTGGLELFYRAWRPAEDTRASVVIAHGLGEHGGRYERLVDALLARGFAVSAMDHRGFGRSPGQRGHVMSWAEYRTDLGSFLDLARQADPGVPLFLYGHSMGALIALDYALEAPGASTHDEGKLRGLILSGVPLEPIGLAKPWLILLAKALSRILPRTALSPGVDARALSRDPEVVRAYEEDPLVHGRATARWGVEALSAIDRAKGRLPELKLPLLVIHGGDDPLNSPDGSRLITDRAGSVDATLRIYEGVRHEPHNDLDWEDAVRDVADWIEARL